MMKVHFDDLKDRLLSILKKYSFEEPEASELALVFTESTFDGVFSHGINRFPRFINDVKNGVVKPGILPEKVNELKAIERWDGLGGAGITNALFCANRSTELASSFGIGCVGLRNTNHWMRGGTYGWKVARKGYLFMGWTNTLPNMPPWGGTNAALGNNPFVMAIPHKEDPIVLDMAMSQYAYGKLEWHLKNGTDLPEFGGFNSDNKLTRKPAEILESERILPTGLWKGSAMSLVLDLAAAILSGGNTTREIGELPDETSLSQVFIAVDVENYFSSDQLQVLVDETLAFNREQNPNARYPGQGSREKRLLHLEHGVEIPKEVWNEIKNL
jgi:3-dehydro-L-gulonate 2-dehydrogenase